MPQVKDDLGKVKDFGTGRGSVSGTSVYMPSTANQVSSNSDSSSYIDMIKQMTKETNEANLASARETNAFNASEAQKERDWSEYMSNTSHQREVEDLIKAGLNPVLSANYGANAYSGSSASGVKADVDNPAPSVANLYATALNNATSLQIANINAKTQRDYNEKYIDMMSKYYKVVGDNGKTANDLQDAYIQAMIQGQNKTTGANILNTLLYPLLFTFGYQTYKHTKKPLG